MRTLLIAVLTVVVAGCSTNAKKEITEAAMDDRGRRLEIMEATLRVLDENPRYVDEFFSLAMRHPRALDEFVAETAARLDDQALAERTARHLAAHPASLRRIMIETLDAAQRRPRARAAIADAIEARAHLAAGLLVDHPEQLAVVSEAIVEEALEHPDTRGKIKVLVKELID